MIEVKDNRPVFSIGLCDLVFVVFLVLKLAEIGPVAEWSWWWVTAPLWGPLAFVLGLCMIVTIGLVIAAVVAVICDKVQEGK